MTQEGLQLIISHEGFRPTAYWDKHGQKWTIGYGTTVYPNGQPVRRGETITRERAAAVLRDTVEKTIVPQINGMVRSRLNQWQLDALTSFAYNCGPNNLRKSTLLQKVNANPNDMSIRDEFLKWNKAGGEVLKGLTERRANEAKLYFKGSRHDTVTRMLADEFGGRLDPQSRARYMEQIGKEKAARMKLSQDFRKRSQEYLRNYARQKQLEKARNSQLSQDFRELYGDKAEQMRYVKPNSQAVNEGLVRKAVAEVVSERLRRAK